MAVNRIVHFESQPRFEGMVVVRYDVCGKRLDNLQVRPNHPLDLRIGFWRQNPENTKEFICDALGLRLTIGFDEDMLKDPTKWKIKDNHTMDAELILENGDRLRLYDRLAFVGHEDAIIALRARYGLWQLEGYAEDPQGKAIIEGGGRPARAKKGLASLTASPRSPRSPSAASSAAPSTPGLEGDGGVEGAVAPSAPSA